MWVLGVEPGSYGRAAVALYQSEPSLQPQWLIPLIPVLWAELGESLRVHLQPELQ